MKEVKVCRCPHCFGVLKHDAKLTVKLPSLWKSLLEEAANERGEILAVMVRGKLLELLLENEKLKHT